MSTLTQGRRRTRVTAVGLLSAVLFLLLGLFGPAAPASAHASLVSSTPLAGEVLERPPTEVVLDFDEPVELSLGGVKLFDGTGVLVPLDAAVTDADDASIVRLAVPALQDGSYVVSYQVLSADSHPATGAFTFQVGAVSTLDPDVIETVVNSSTTSDTAKLILSLLRVLMYAGLIIVGGFLATMAIGIVGPTVQHRRIVRIGALVAGLAGLLQLPMEAGFLTGQGPSAIADLGAWSDIIGTRTGRVWLARAVVAYFGGLGLVMSVERYRRRWWRLGVAVLLLVLAALSAAGGHGSTGRWVPLGIGATIVHVVAAMVWIGGLGALLVRPEELTDDALRRFSRLARIGAGAVVLTGLVQGLRRIESTDVLLHTDYGRLVIAKAFSVAVILGFAATSRAVVRGAALGTDTAEPVGIDRRTLVRSVRAELLFALAAVAITASLMGANPGEASPTEPFSTTLVSDGYIASIAVEPAGVGPNQVHIYLSSPGGSLSKPDSVTAVLEEPVKGIAPFEIALVSVGANHFQALGASVPFAGDWQLTITAIYDTFTKVEFVATVPVD